MFFRKNLKTGQCFFSMNVDDIDIFPDWKDYDFHREDGPAIDYVGIIRWYINGVDISGSVEQWITDRGLPLWPEWTTREQTLYKLTWV